MFLHKITVRAAWLTTLVVTLVLISSIVADSESRRTRLDADALSLSRGGNPMVVLDQGLCNDYNIFKPCGAPNDQCDYCDHQYYTKLKMGTNGGYKSTGGGADCGWWWSGRCDANKDCQQNTLNGFCVQPPTVAVQ